MSDETPSTAMKGPTEPEEVQEQSSKKKEGPIRELSPASKEAMEVLGSLATPEEKINRALEFMRTSLTQAGNPRLKDFWDMRHHCLGLFKESLSTASRSHLWSAYVELSAEARRLKEILNEQSAFASEQIELAISALEQDLVEYEARVAQMKLGNIVASSSTIKEKQEFYQRLQGELNLLNTLASRVNALRKEIIKTDMRMKTKAKFFDKLSAAGDQIFPRRKELVKEISEQFVDDVRRFVDKEFSTEIGKAGPLYILRDEIKVLQGIAKVLTLNTHAFKETREMLSACWDKIRESEKKKKEEFAQKKQESQKNVDLVMQKISVLMENAKKEEATLAGLQSETGAILDFMKSLDLDRDAVRSLKSQIKQVLQPFVDREKSAEESRLEQRRFEEQKKKEAVLAVLRRAEELVANAPSFDIPHITAQREGLQSEFATLEPGKMEVLRFEKLMRKLTDAVMDKKEKTLLAQDRESLMQLKELLDERCRARDEIKKNLEVCRKALGGSGFDFEKAMMYREMMDSDKEQLEKINKSIEEIEDKIAEIEG